MKKLFTTFELNKSKIGEDLKINRYGDGGKQALIFIGGSGDDRNYFENICVSLSLKSTWDIFTYSIRGLETGRQFPLYQQILDLREVVDFILNSKKYKSIILVSTSMGSIAMSAMLVDPGYGKYFSKAVYLDPADYYLKLNSLTEPDTWSGEKEYCPVEPTVSDMLVDIRSQVKVYVVGFYLNNCIKNDYAFSDFVQRGIDVAGGHPRLNQKMTKSFFEKTPRDNRGNYIENHTLPHAFERDGDIARNENEVVKILVGVLTLGS
jgi:pimeloyl-ACP methyl ester carboxylesterase